MGVSGNKGCSTKGFPLYLNKMGVFAVYIISKAGGLIYSLDNQKPPAETQLLCKYPPSFVLEEGDRGVMVKFGEEGGVKGKCTVHMCVCIRMCTYVYSLLVSSVSLPFLLFLLCGSWSHPSDSQRPACHQSQIARRPECSGVSVKAGELPSVTNICPPEGSCQ